MRFPICCMLIANALSSQVSAQTVVSRQNPTKAAPALAMSQKIYEITGQVFVVTRGKEAVRLPLVKVSVYTEDDLRQQITPLYAALLVEQSAHLHALQIAKADVQQAEVRMIESENAVDLANQAYAEKKLQERLEKVWTAGDARLDTWKQAETLRASRARAAQKVVNASNSEPLWDGLLTPSYIEKTDIDGKFHLALPAGGYVLLARDSRATPNGVESYNWRVRIQVTSNQKLMLSNDNLVGTECAECVALPLRW